jgi:hypothetical protein
MSDHICVDRKPADTSGVELTFQRAHKCRCRLSSIVAVARHAARSEAAAGAVKTIEKKNSKIEQDQAITTCKEEASRPLSS